jgi:hypothetical protein
MRGRALALLLLLYLTLDLTNPLMPGAVYFDDGRLDVMDVRRPPADDVPAPAPVVRATPLPTGLVRLPVPPRLSAVADHPRPWTPARRALPSAPDPAPSPDDH